MNDTRPPLGGRHASFDEEYEDEVTSVSVPPTIEGRRPVKSNPARDRATFTLATGPNTGAIYTLLAEQNEIGRGRECSIRVDDPGISRKHARVVRQAPGVYVVEDLG